MNGQGKDDSNSMIFQGKDLRDTSNQGLGRADAYLIENNKKESVILFLFDHLLIICRKVC